MHGTTGRWLAAAAAGVTVMASIASAQQPEPLPKVVLVGDSIRLGYAPLVADALKDRAVVVSTPENGGDSANVLRNLEQWVIRERPALLHLNCGLHDLKFDRTTRQHQVPLEAYRRNLSLLVERLRAAGIPFVFANTTPIHDLRHAGRGAGFDRTEKDVLAYNACAEEVMRQAGAPVHDLHWVVTKGGADQLLGGDGTHYTPRGNSLLAEAVADCLRRNLVVMNPRPLPAPSGGAAAAAAYARDETERDAAVPARFRKLPEPLYPKRGAASAWPKQRQEILRLVSASLGVLPPRPNPPAARVISRELRPGCVLERVAIDNGDGEDVSSLILTPYGGGKRPAVLWLHSSTPDKNQVITPNTNGGASSLGEELVKRGYVVMAPDAYWHGDREGTGPAGRAENIRGEHESLFKYHLWMGRTLWGMFVRDDQVALDYLCGRPEVDAKRVGATGMSMGSTRAWWLGAMDERVTAVVATACLTRYRNLIAHGQLRQHGVYYFTMGLLPKLDAEAVIALIAPRAFLGLTGELDAGSPADGIREIERRVAPVYRSIGASERFRSVLYPEVGHTVTPEMRRETLEWFDRWLSPGPR